MEYEEDLTKDCPAELQCFMSWLKRILPDHPTVVKMDQDLESWINSFNESWISLQEDEMFVVACKKHCQSSKV